MMLMKVKVSPITKSRSRQLRREMTDAERRLWGLLSNRQIYGVRFRRQVPFGPFIADFASHEARLVVEIDGGQHADRSMSEGNRTAFLADEGYRVLRFWNNEVIENLDGVYAVITEAVAASHRTSAREDV